MAELPDIEPGYVAACMAAQRAQGPEARKMWGDGCKGHGWRQAAPSIEDVKRTAMETQITNETRCLMRQVPRGKLESRHHGRREMPAHGGPEGQSVRGDRHRRHRRESARMHGATG